MKRCLQNTNVMILQSYDRPPRAMLPHCYQIRYVGVVNVQRRGQSQCQNKVEAGEQSDADAPCTNVAQIDVFFFSTNHWPPAWCPVSTNLCYTRYVGCPYFLPEIDQPCMPFFGSCPCTVQCIPMSAHCRGCEVIAWLMDQTLKYAPRRTMPIYVRVVSTLHTVVSGLIGRPHYHNYHHHHGLHSMSHKQNGGIGHSDLVVNCQIAARYRSSQHFIPVV